MNATVMTRYLGPVVALGAATLLTLTAAAATTDIPASDEIFLRTLSPDVTHDADLVSVRKLSGEVRYGVIQFDLSALAGQTVTGVELVLDEIGSAQAGTDANFPLVSAAYAIGTADEVPDLLSMTWNTYQGAYEGQEAGPFATLGAYNLPANGTARADRSTFADAADRASIQGIVDRPFNNVLTLVLKAVNLNEAHAFGDGQAYGNKAILRVTTGENEPPAVTGIATEPADPANLPINSRVTLTATVTGTGPLAYQWHRDAQPVTGATNLTLTLAALDPGLAGNYTLAVTGPGGSTTSAAVSVTVDAAHTLVDLAASEDVWIRDYAPTTTYNGDFVDVRRTIDTSLNGPVEVRYGLLQFDLSSLAGQTVTSAELILDELGTGQGAGSGALAPIQTLAFAIATEHNAPSLLTMTWDTYASTYEGQEAYAFGSLGIYDLTANGALRADRSSLANAADLTFLQGLITSANSLTLVLKPVATEVNLAHSFGDGEAAGNNAILRLVKSVPTTPPAVSPITVAPGAVNVPVGRRTTLSVTASGTGTLLYQWRLNGEPVPGAAAATLVLEAIQPSQAGDYTVVVTDLVGTTTSAVATVTVDASALQIECTEDVWIGTVAADRTFNGDFLDARRTSAGDVRYGLVQFDLSPFTGKTVTSVELILDELGSNQGVGSSATMPIQTAAFALGTSSAPPSLLAMTWDAYQATYEGLEDFAFTSLGVYDLPANGALRADRSSFADSADVALVQRLVDAKLPLTLVLKPTDPGQNLAHSFGDGESGGNNAKLVVRTGSVWVSAITVQPGASNIPVGRTTTLSVQGGGVGAITYQWRLNGEPIPNASTPTLVLNAIQPGNAGTYTVVVTDSVGSTASPPVTVTVDASAFELECVEDVWIRDVAPDTTYNADFVDLRRTTEIRYGLIQFDLTAMAGKTVTGAELILDELGLDEGAGSSADLPCLSVAFAIGVSGGVPDLLATTWSTYQAEYEGQEDLAFATLGAYDLPPNGHTRANRSTFASPADVALVQTLVNAMKPFTLVLKPADPGYAIGHSFGDGESKGNNAKLIIRTASSPTLTVTRQGANLMLSWPASATGWKLQTAPALNSPGTWTDVPGSTQVHEVSWPMTGTAGYFRLSQ